METPRGVLANHPFAQGLNHRHLELLVGCASNIRFEAGQLVFSEDEKANQFYLIREGKVAVERFASERGPINILTLGEGEVLGWSWRFRRIAGGSTLTRSSQRELLRSMASVSVRNL